MTEGRNVTMLGTGLIGRFYTQTIQRHRSRDCVRVVYSRSAERAETFASQWGIDESTDDLEGAINDPRTDTVMIGLPNDLHLSVVETAAKANKAVLCTKPLGRTADEAKKMLDLVEQYEVFHGYLEDFAYTAKMLRSLEAVEQGAVGDVIWVRSREAHSGPHSSWFWDPQKAGGGAIIDLGCHCIEVGRNFIGKQHKPVEVMCWADTLYHPIDAEDNAIGLVRYANGAIGQFEAGWVFRGGMDIRDEVGGTEGTIWLNHFLRTGFEMFTTGGQNAYVAEKAESEKGWLFPVGDECHELGYPEMFQDMFDSVEAGSKPRETFYDGYVVNAVMDACYRSAKTKHWEPIELSDWRGTDPREERNNGGHEEVDGHVLIKSERMPDGQLRRILKDKQSGDVFERVD